MLGRVEKSKTRRSSPIGSDATDRASPHILVLEKLIVFLRIPQLLERRQQPRETLAFHPFCTAVHAYLSSPQKGSASWTTVVHNTVLAMPVPRSCQICEVHALPK